MIVTDIIVVAAGYKNGIELELWPDAIPTVARYVRLLLRSGAILTSTEATMLHPLTLAVIVAEREKLIDMALNPPETTEEKIERVLDENGRELRETYDNLKFLLN